MAYHLSLQKTASDLLSAFFLSPVENWWVSHPMLEANVSFRHLISAPTVPFGLILGEAVISRVLRTDVLDRGVLSADGL